MLLKLCALALVTVSVVTAQLPLVKRQEPISIDHNQLSLVFASWAAKQTAAAPLAVPTVQLALEPVPKGIAAQILTGVPPQVLVQLFNPNARAAMAAEFRAGNTPAWYQAMPTGLQNYFNNMAQQIKAGNGILTVTPTPTTWANAARTNMAAAAAASVSSVSSAALAPRATGGVDKTLAAMVAGAVGVLGAAVAL